MRSIAVLLLTLHLAAAAGTRVVTCPSGANCTAILQSAIDAGGDFTVAGCFTVLPIFLRSNSQTITFEAGSSVVAHPGAFHASDACLFTVHAAKDVTIVGNGARWTMQRRDYNNTAKYAHSEHRHALSIMSSTTIAVRDVRIYETGGDGIYIALSSNVEIRNVTTDGAYRNGLSLISASNVLVTGSRFLRTAGTAPEAGIDIEPNHAKPGHRPEELVKIVFQNNEARENLGCGLSISDSKLTAAGALDIVVDGMAIEGAAGLHYTDAQLEFNIGILIGGVKQPNATRPGSILLNNVSITNTAQPGLEVFGKLVNGAKTTVQNLRLDRVATASAVRWGGQNVPILLHQSAPSVVGGIAVDTCEIVDTKARPFLRCDSCDSRGSATNISGNFVVRNPHGCTMSLGPSLSIT